MGKKSQIKFKLVSEFQPSGDQPEAIASLVENFRKKIHHQVLLGVTGSGKTFTMANVIQQLNVPTLILAPNKTLAAQLFIEFKELFPQNAVEYFVSYYDYYQPEAFIPSTQTFIEKDSAINDQIDRMRHSATHSLFERRDVIIVSSVSCIYGLGNPETYEEMVLTIQANSDMKRDFFLKELIRIQYKRSDLDFHRGTFRVRGDLVEIHPPYEESQVIRVEFFGDFIDKISWVDPLRGEVLDQMEEVAIYPGSHYVTSSERIQKATETIRKELQERIRSFRDDIMFKEAERIEQRTLYDLEFMQEMGFCPGIENYSRHLTGRTSGEPPPTLLEFFDKDFLMIVDECHVTIPQVGGMYRGDRSRKSTLVEHGFRLPSALDNRPLNFQEFEGLTNDMLFVSATPGDYEFKKSEGIIVEQIIRPTGLLDPVVEVRPVKYQVDDLLKEIQIRSEKGERVLVTTLTKRTSEDLTTHYESLGVKVKYLHSDIKTMERTQILRDLRLGVFDVLIGINLLREGLDIPEVSLVAITDADKEGFLRSERSLIQTMGRAARNVEGRVILYADRVTQSMDKAIKETERRRVIQDAHNKEHGIVPQTIYKKVQRGLLESFGDSSGENMLKFRPEKTGKGRRVAEGDVPYLPAPKDVRAKVVELKSKMKKAAKELDFELAAELRDEVKRLELLELEMM